MRLMSRMSRKQIRISRREQSRKVSEVYAMYNGNAHVRNTLDNELNKSALKSIKEFSSYRINKKDWDKNMRDIKQLHRNTTIVLNNLAHAQQQSILTVNRKHLTKLQKTMDAFNDYIENVNPLYKLKYSKLEEINLPKEVILYCECGFQ